MIMIIIVNFSILIIVECVRFLIGGIGARLHPRGGPNPAVYSLIGNVYRRIRACEPYVEGGRLVSQIALLADPESATDFCLFLLS